MNTSLFENIDIFLTVERKFNTMVDDRFLRNYAEPFKHMSDDWKAPDWWEAEYRRIEKKQRQHKETVTLAASNVTVDLDENGDLTIRQGANAIRIGADQRTPFLSLFFSLPMTGPPLAGVISGQASAPTNIGGNHLENDDRPGMKERMERSLVITVGCTLYILVG